MRVVGLDLGGRRIGVAVSDSSGVFASPRRTLVRSGDADADRRAIAAVAVEEGAARVVVGLPLNLDGRRGASARAATTEADALRPLLEPHGITVETFDERLTTVSAERRLAEAGRRGRARRKVVDQAAAAVMLQAWLDTQSGRRASETGTGDLGP